MAWTGLNLTVDGRSALNKAQTDKRLNFKSIIIGDGNPPGNFSAIKQLVHQLYEVTELKIDITDDGCMLTADLPDVDYDYYMREIGVVVTTDDGDKLYVYDNCGDDAQYIVSTTGAEKTQKRIRLVLMVSDVENITVSKPSIMYVAYDDFEKAVADLKQGKVDISGGDVSDTKVLFDAGNDSLNGDDVNIASGDSLGIIFRKIYRAIKVFFTHKSDKVIHTTQADKDKLAGIEERANNYVHPDTHPAGMITPDENHQFASAAEKESWNNSLSDAKTYADGMYRQAAGYTDKKISDLIGGAPESLDTLKEVADAIKENKTVMDALDASIGKKAGQAELDTHTGNSTIHITASERTKWNNDVSKTGDASDTTVSFTQAAARVKPSAGEKLSEIVGKIVRWLSDLKIVAFTGSYSDLNNVPSSFPASDVYSWAKAATKPSYSWNEIGSKPTNIMYSDKLNSEILSSSVTYSTVADSNYISPNEYNIDDFSGNSIVWVNSYLTSYKGNLPRNNIHSLLITNRGCNQVWIDAVGISFRHRDSPQHSWGDWYDIAGDNYLSKSGGSMSGAISMNGNALNLYSNTQRIEANAQDLNLIVTGSKSGTGYINARVESAFQVRDTSNGSWKPVNASAFYTQSSERYKEHVADMSDEKAKNILKYRVVTYDYINKADGINCEGMIAEEVAELDEYPVYKTSDGVIEGLDYSKFVPQMIKMIQIQQKEIDELKEALDMQS